MQWSDGAIYQGQWYESRASGIGKFTHINDDTYQGEWKDDKANGWGIFKRIENVEFNQAPLELRGQFKND